MSNYVVDCGSPSSIDEFEEKVESMIEEGSFPLTFRVYGDNYTVKNEGELSCAFNLFKNMYENTYKGS